MDREPFLPAASHNQLAPRDGLPGDHHNGRVSWRLVSSLFRILRLASSNQSAWLLLALLPATLAYVLTAYHLILYPGEVYAALVALHPSAPQVRRIIGGFVVTVSLAIATRATVAVLRDLASNCLRLKLAKQLHRNYFDNAAFFRLASTNIDNPDQRITEDVTKTLNTFCTLLAGRQQGGGGLLEASMSVVWYTVQTLRRTGIAGVLISYAWSLATAVLTILTLSWVAPVVAAQDKAEADLRFLHTRVRQHRHNISSLSSCAVPERIQADDALNTAVQNFRSLIFRQTLILVGILQTGYGYAISVVMYTLISILIIVASSDSTLVPAEPEERAKWISQTAGIFMSLLWSFTMVIQLGKDVSDLAAFTTRLSELMYQLEKTQEIYRKPQCTEDSVLVRELSAWTPGGHRRLVHKLSLELRAGDHVLLVGPSGSGKTTVFRILRGLYPADNFSASALSRPSLFSEVSSRPGNQATGIFFLESHPYLLHAKPLLHQVVYPTQPTSSKAEWAKVEDALARVGLLHLLPRTTSSLDQNLSDGEKQRLAVARVLFHRPAFVVLDEATGQLDEVNEERCLKEIASQGSAILQFRHHTPSWIREDSAVEVIALE